MKTAIVCHPFYGLFVHNKTDIAYYRSGNLLNVSQRVRSQGTTLIQTNVKYWISRLGTGQNWEMKRVSLAFSWFLCVLSCVHLRTVSALWWGKSIVSSFNWEIDTKLVFKYKWYPYGKSRKYRSFKKPVLEKKPLFVLTSRKLLRAFYSSEQ